jgi:Outer membrane receptor for ferric coprogen and ferric-rhodotorulic acid
MLMKRTPALTRAAMATSALCFAVAPGLRAQAASEAAETELGQDEPIVLSPFVVDATEDTGSYQANSTLAGTRIRTDLRDLSSAISVVTKQFLDDVGAKSNTDLLVYTTNTEVAGPRGNFSSVAGGQNYNESVVRPQANTRVRGLDRADNTRDYFLTEIPWDSYNVDRIDLQRGPNSILFGLGSPAGIINASVNTAGFKNSRKVENRFDEFGSIRTSLDLNQVIVPNTLSIRVSALEDHAKYQQKPAYRDDRRQFTALRYEPKLFGEQNPTSFRVNYERGEIDANYPRSIPPVDTITPWFNSLNKLTLDPNEARASFGTAGGAQAWFPNEAFMGNQFSADIVGYYPNTDSASPNFAVIATNNYMGFGIGTDGAIDRGIGGIYQYRPFNIAVFSQYARTAEAGIPGGAFYGDYSLMDPTIFDFYHNLLDGPNKHEFEDWTAANFAFSQSFLNNRLNLELVYDRQRYTNGGRGGLGGRAYGISVDFNEYRADGSANPDLGRPYVAAGYGGGSYNESYRDVYRATLVGELRADDFLEKSWLTTFLGRHLITGLYTDDTRKTANINWKGAAPEAALLEQVHNISPGVLNSNERNYEWVTYIGPDLRGASSASGANLSRLTTFIQPPRDIALKFFDSHWNAPDVDPAAEYIFLNPLGEIQTSTQSENPDNYVGWRTQTFRMLNGDDPEDRESLYTGAQRNRVTTESRAITWQGYLLDGNLVGTFGWRRDEVKNVANNATRDALGVSSPHFNFVENAGNTRVVTGESKTWGAVAHLPKQWAEKMPLGTTISAFYNRGQNFKADAPRADVEGKILPNPTGRTKDYGFVIRTLDDKLSLKVNWYETQVGNATLQAGTNGGFGSTAYYLWAVPSWAVTHAIAGYEYMNGRNPNDAWIGNYAAQAAGADAGDTNWQPGTPNFENSEATALQRAAYADFFNNMPLTQSFFDAYGMQVSVAGLKSGDPRNGLVPAWQAGYRNDIQPSGNGNILSVGAPPVTTTDTLSKGVEYELVAQPTKNWNISLNASKTFASLTNVAGTIRDYIDTYTDFLAGPAGDIRLWGTDPNNSFRNYWRDNILAPYNVILSNEGRMVPELAKWRFNGVTTYRFDEGALKGSWIGGAVRWEGKRIIGYAYSSQIGSLDVTSPFYSPEEIHYDMWVGYSRKLTPKVNWRIQLNLRNVGEDNHIVPISKNPDGSTNFVRIVEGMSWQITNTFQF